MNMVLDQMMLLGGLALAAVALVLGAAWALVYKAKRRRLNELLDEEFGKLTDK